MNQARSKDVQQTLTKEALSLQELGGSKTNVANYEQVIRLVGKASGIPRSETEDRLALIRQNRDDLRRIEAGESVQARVFKEEHFCANWSGLETLDMITDLFEISLNLERRGERQALYNMAMELMETQCLLDWIEKTESEKELPEIASA